MARSAGAWITFRAPRLQAFFLADALSTASGRCCIVEKSMPCSVTIHRSARSTTIGQPPTIGIAGSFHPQRQTRRKIPAPLGDPAAATGAVRSAAMPSGLACGAAIQKERQATVAAAGDGSSRHTSGYGCREGRLRRQRGAKRTANTAHSGAGGTQLRRCASRWGPTSARISSIWSSRVLRAGMY